MTEVVTKDGHVHAEEIDASVSGLNEIGSPDETVLWKLSSGGNVKAVSYIDNTSGVSHIATAGAHTSKTSDPLLNPAITVKVDGNLKFQINTSGELRVAGRLHDSSKPDGGLPFPRFTE